MKKTVIYYFPLLIILIFALVLRTVFLNVSPPGLSIDEAALGYNAYSLLLTGRDEHGIFLPIALESFGDWKLPVYSYVATIPILFLGLNEFSTRLPSIIAGVLGVFIIYFIAQLLFSKRGVSICASFFYAVSPWNIYFSRAAYEVNFATTVFLGGLALFLFGLKKGNLYLFLSSIIFSITLFTYHSFIIFTPLFLTFLIIFFRKKLGKKIIVLVIPFAIFFILSLSSNYFVGLSKFQTTTIFNNKDIIYNRSENFRKDTNGFLYDKIYTKYSAVTYQIAQNYLLSFSPTFLFDRGGEKLVHNLDGFGNLYIFDSLLILAGLAGLFYFREKKLPIIILWFVVAPIPSALTLDAPNSTRLFILMPLFSLICGYAAWSIYKYLNRNNLGKVLLIFLGILFIINFIYFINLYFIHFKYHRARFWNYGYKEVVGIINDKKPEKIIFSSPDNFPYIYYVFYNSYNPAKFQKQVKYYPKTWDNFRYVKSFGNVNIVTDIEFNSLKNNTFYINDKMYVTDSKFLTKFNKVFLPDGDKILGWYYYKE